MVLYVSNHFQGYKEIQIAFDQDHVHFDSSFAAISKSYYTAPKEVPKEIPKVALKRLQKRPKRRGCIFSNLEVCFLDFGMPDDILKP